METKQCSCGNIIVRSPDKQIHHDHNWNKIKKCNQCKVPQALVGVKTESGNEFWKALAVGEIPASLQDEYEKHKRETRRLFKRLQAA